MGALALFMGGLIVLDILVDFRPGAGQFVCAGVGVVLLGSGLLLIVRGPSAVLSKEGEAALASRLEKRAEREGLPTEPEAYQDGGLAVAATALTVEEAEVVASVLRGADIPAWVHNRHLAGWYWYAQYAMFPDGFQVVVPQGRLADAEAVLAEGRSEAQGAGESAEEQVDEERGEEESRMVRQALGLAALALLLGPLAPWVLYRAFKLSAAIAGARRQWWTSQALRRANRWSLAAMFLATVGAAAWWFFLIPSMVSSCGR
jgi:hypothetical protein